MSTSIVTALLILTSSGQSQKIEFIDAKSCAAVVCDHQAACETLAKNNDFFPRGVVEAKCVTQVSADENDAPKFFTGPSPWHHAATARKRRHR